MIAAQFTSWLFRGFLKASHSQGAANGYTFHCFRCDSITARLPSVEAAEAVAALHQEQHAKEHT